MITVKCSFLRALYEGERGYNVFLYHLNSPLPGKRIGESIIAVGYCLGNAPDAEYILKGEWVRTQRGMQFQVKDYDEERGCGVGAVVGFLKTIDGIGAITAKRIYKHFGDKTLQVLDEDPNRIAEVGIKGKRLARIVQSYKAGRGAKDLIKLLVPLGVKASFVVGLYDKYGDKAQDEVKKNPFALIKQGLLFAICDKIATAVGFSKTAPERIVAGINEAFSELEMSTGSAGFDGKVLAARIQKILGPEVNKNVLQKITQNMVDQKNIFYVRGKWFSEKAYKAECSVAKRVVTLVNGNFSRIDNLDKAIDEWEETNKMKLHTEQRKAVFTSLSSGFSVITGGAGRGKTTIARCICDIRKTKGKEKSLLLLSPTGKAAQRLSQSTGETASTIHSALQIGTGEDEHPDINVYAGTIIVDEASMLDLWIADTLFNAIQNGSQVILVGDINQLPSVGCGAVLRDIIMSGIVPVTELIKTYRQGDGSVIVTNADKIKDGDQSIVPDPTCFKLWNANDTHLHGANDFERSADIMARLYKSMVKKYGKDEVICLSPFHHAQSASSVDEMNKKLQNMMNPDGDYLKHKGHIYRLGDLVLQTKNEGGFQNGDIGTIISLNAEEETITVHFPDGREREYIGEDLDMLELAYALSIHKSQGSEYKCVILNLLPGHTVMLKRNLLYTAVTRAKVEVNLVTTPDALKKAIGTEDTTVRFTLLKEKIQQISRQERNLKRAKEVFSEAG